MKRYIFPNFDWDEEQETVSPDGYLLDIDDVRDMIEGILKEFGKEDLTEKFLIAYGIQETEKEKKGL